MWMILSEYHAWYHVFKVHWIIFSLLLSYVYVKKFVVGPLYQSSFNQRLYFFIALTLFACLKASPLDVIGTYYLFSVHVMQVSFISFIVIPLFILSLPKSFLRRLIWNYRTRLVMTILSHPWLSLIVFNGLLTIYFMPTVFTFLQEHLLLQLLFQLVLMITAICMWFVIIQPVQEFQTLNPLLRAVYIFLASLILMPIGFYFVLVQKVHLPIYHEMEGMIIPILNIIYDQQLAGGILKMTQMFSYALALLFIMLQWGRDEQAKEGSVNEKNLRYIQGIVIHLDDKNK